MRLLEWNILENCGEEDNNEAVILFLHSSFHCSLKKRPLFRLVWLSFSSIFPLSEISAEPRINENNNISATLKCIKAQIGRTVAVSLWLSGQSLGSCGEWLQEDRSSEKLRSPWKCLDSTSFSSLPLADFIFSPTFQTIRLKHINLHRESFPCNHGACKWGIIRVGQQGLSSLFEDYASLSSGLAQTLATLF